MDKPNENEPSNSSGSSLNCPPPNAHSHVSSSFSSQGNGEIAAGASSVDDASQSGTKVLNAQNARSGGIGLTTSIGTDRSADLQRKLEQKQQELPTKPVEFQSKSPLVQGVNSVPIAAGPSPLSSSSGPEQNGGAWAGVPNPLTGGTVSGKAPGAASSQVQPYDSAPPATIQPAPVSVTPQSSLKLQPATQPPQVQPRPVVAQIPGVSVSLPPPNGSNGNQKPKVVLSQEAKAALGKAIWSAIRSPQGEIAPDLMQAALATGLPRQAIVNAARVAREREAQKRKQQTINQPSNRQQQQQTPHQSSSLPQHPKQQQSLHQPSSLQQHPQQQQSLQRQQPPPKQQPLQLPHRPPATASSSTSNLAPIAIKPPLKVTSLPTVSKTPVPSKGVHSTAQTQPRTPTATVSKTKPTPAVQQQQAAKALQAKAEERAKWNLVLHGIFMMQKGKFIATANSICGVVRGDNSKPRVPCQSNRKRPRSELRAEAAELQAMLRGSTTKPSTLLDPDKYKRAKIEPKKFAKALDRIVRKARQTAAETLIKQHKEFSKAIVGHQQEFFKFHKQRKVDALKLAKTIRDNFDKESKKKEKDAVAAERARLAALKANDMDAYSKLLEETKNDRLKFLMDKTEKHFSQISTSLLQTRNKDGSVAASGGTASYYASAHLQTEEVRQPSILLGGDLKEYQMSGLQWLVSLYNNKLNGILADEMGLGKTIQAISLVAYLMEFKSNLGPYLVIVPLSTLSNWVNEFQKWCPSAHVICYKGTPAQRREIYKEQVRNGHFNVLLTTYEYIIKDKANLRKIEWQYAIVDEGHRMKNAASKFAKTLSSQYSTKYRLLLTGTPLMNDLSELWALLNFLLPDIFNSVDTFDQWFNRPFAQFGGGTNEDEANFLTNEERMFIIHRLHELLRPFMLRRVKSEVLDQLPEKVEKILRCELSSWQKELYKQISQKAQMENNPAGTGFVQPQPASRGLNNVVMQLRKVCNHPYLFSPQGYQINENIIRSSGKLELLERMLPKLRAAGHRVLMFTQMTAVMTILEDYFRYKGFLSLRLDGSTPAEEREKRMYKFNAPDSPYFIFLLSTRAGGLGLNLTSANTVIIFDSDWNPMMDLQAQDRAHRIGQRSDVSVFRLVTRSPVEEKILSRATEKLNMSELVVEAGKFDKRSVENDNSLERKRMMEVLLTDFDSNTAKGAEEKATSELTGSEVGDDDDDDEDDGSENSKEEDLNDMISNNEADYQLYDEMDKERAQDPAAIDCCLFTNEDDVPDWVKYPTGKKDAALHDNSIPADGPRKRKEVMYDDGLTEKQFMRMMDKQYDGEQSARGQAKASRRSSESEIVIPETASAPVESGLTDWTFRKLISCTKSVIALKDPKTKRRLSDIFLEKPSPEQFPDYYEIIQKPIAINDILRKCRGKLYATMQEFHDDWKIMFANAKTFNGDGSWVVEDGRALEKELDRVLKKNGFHEETLPQKPTPTPKPKKKLRIKLSLKSLKAKETNADTVQDDNGESLQGYDDVPTSGRGRRKKRKIE